MTARFVSNLLLVIVGAALMVTSVVFAPVLVRWLALGVGCAAVVVTAVAFLGRGRGALQRGLDLLAAILGTWMIVASRVFGGHALRWLTVAEAGALFALGVVGLIAHEVVVERAVRMRAADANVDRGERDGRPRADSEAARVRARTAERVVTG